MSSPSPDDSPQNPWILTSEKVLAATNASFRPAVLLVLGAPSAQDLLPLIHSQILSSSLLILAVHQPPIIPPSALPAVRIIRLPAPLEVENATAVHLVSALERAERVARIWRKNRVMGVIELPDNDDGATLHIDSRYNYRSSDAPPSPASSSEHLNPPQNRWSKVSISSKGLTKLLNGGLPPVDPTQRPFDALFNYLPANIADKSLLKQAILVTTISHPFLCAVSAPSTTRSSSRADSSEKQNRWSASIFRGWANSIPSPPPSENHSLSSRGPSPSLADLSPDRAHLVHLLPLSPRHYHHSANPGPNLGIGRSKLIQSLESFLQSFAYPLRSYIPTPNDSTATATDRAAAYFLPASTLGSSIQYAPTTDEQQTPPTCTVVDMLLRGLLDPPSPPPGAAARQKQRADTSPPRVWIGGPQDVLVLGSHWSNGNGAGLAKLSLAARPGLGLGRGLGLGLGMAPRPRSRVSTGRVALSTSPMGPRSASTPNVEKLGRPFGPKHKSSLPDSLASRAIVTVPNKAGGSGAPFPVGGEAPALTRAETDMIVSAFRKPVPVLPSRPLPRTATATVTGRGVLLPRAFTLYDQSSIGSDKPEDAGVVTPPESEELAGTAAAAADVTASISLGSSSVRRPEAAVVASVKNDNDNEGEGGGAGPHSSPSKLVARPALRSGANSVYGSLRKSMSYLGAKTVGERKGLGIGKGGENGNGNGNGSASGSTNGSTNGRKKRRWYFWRGSRMMDPWVTAVGV